MPSYWQIVEFENRRIEFGDVLKTNDDRVVNRSILIVEKLPSAVIGIVHDVGNEAVSTDDPPKRNNGEVPRFSKCPGTRHRQLTSGLQDLHSGAQEALSHAAVAGSTRLPTSENTRA